MTPTQRLSFQFALVIMVLPGLAGARLQAQGLQLTGQVPPPRSSAAPVPAAAPAGAVLAKPSPSQTFSAPVGLPVFAGAPRTSSLLDEPATPAKVDVTPAGLTIVASNASLTDVIRQVALQTSMQVEGNSREQRIFGVYGPGSPPDVLSALLYDSGYNVLMVGSGTDGVPRRLVLSQRASQSAAQAAASAQPVRNSDEEDEPEQQEAPQLAAPQQSLQPVQTPPAAGEHGGVRTPQQMLEELQRMHQGQQPQDVPKDPQ